MNQTEMHPCAGPYCNWVTYTCEWGYCSKCCTRLHSGFSHALATLGSNNAGFKVDHHPSHKLKEVTDPEPPVFGEVKEAEAETSTTVGYPEPRWTGGYLCY